MTVRRGHRQGGQPDLSVIIPCLNEATTLPHLLQDLNKQQGLRLEILVADGGSGDATPQLARGEGAVVIESAPGRGRQMNTAAEQAQADWLLFLHADSRLTAADQLVRALQHLSDAQAGTGHRRIAGHFALQFVGEPAGHNPLLYRYMAAKTRFDRPYCVNGDQGMLLHRSYFAALGGFDASLPFLEDLRLAERITHKGAQTGQWHLLPGQLQTSARRFETEGAGRYLLMALIVIAEAADIPEFIAHSPRLYQSQDSTGRILLTPYFRLLARIARQRGWRGTWRGLLNIGRLSRYHWWQLFLLVDVLLGLKRRPFLAGYDRLIYPLTANPLGDALTAVMAWVFGLWVLRPYFRLREHRALKAMPRQETSS